jgi:hypothetical protein
LAAALGATTVTATGNISLHGFNSCDIALRYLCLALIFTSGKSKHLLSYHKHAQWWFNQMPIHHCAGKAPASSGKPGWGADVGEFFVVAFGIGPNMQRHEDLLERMPFFYVVARYTGATQAPAHQPKSFNDFVIVISDLAFYRKHYSSIECSKPRKNDFGNAVYIRPIHTDSSLFRVSGFVPWRLPLWLGAPMPLMLATGVLVSSPLFLYGILS